MVRFHPKRAVAFVVFVLGVVFVHQKMNPAFNHNAEGHGWAEEFIESPGNVRAARAEADASPPAAPPPSPTPRPSPPPPPAKAARQDKYPNYQYQLTPPRDYRANECKAEHERLQALPKDALPTCSVVLAFCNEPTKSLYHTIYSVMERSPPHLLHEFILVDDGSDAPHIGTPLEKFCRELPVPCKIVRMGGREGLMRSRVAGARAASGDTVLFLDSHVSPSIGFLEPMMYRISQGRHHIVMPKIDGADRDFNYKAGGVELVGFNTGVVDHGMSMMKKDRFKGRTALDPVASPAMAGGLFAVHREYFFEIGAFDEKMLHWGGENIEIGWRAWQCGGSIELIPCSRIAHVWGGMGKGCGWKGPQPGAINKWRGIEVWIEKPYQKYFERFLPNPGNLGDISKMLEVKKRLKCKDFKYFLKEAYPECWVNQLATRKHEGLLRNIGTGQCFNPGNFRQGPGNGGTMERCAISDTFRGNTQYLWNTQHDEILVNPPRGSDDIDQCLDGYPDPGQKLLMYGCHGYGGKQKHVYHEDTQQLKANDKGCLEHTKEDLPRMAKCEDNNNRQAWEWISLAGGPWIRPPGSY